MQAPTHITGPDGTLCRKGDEIPAEWFDELPDLQDHLDNLGTSAEPDPPLPSPDVEAVRVKATATVKRLRGQS